MCGIAGFVGRGGTADIQAMTRALAHRGPDGEGFHCDPDRQVYLGHRRLSVVDIAGGDQPMWDAEETLCVVFNGEIYNHRALRKELEGRGARFRSDHSDTEVLIQGYKHWGGALLERLNGMFAFGIYDRRDGSILLARDRFGEKPLFWARHDGTVAFASELPALLRHSRLRDVTLDRAGARKFFAFGLFPGATTPWHGVAKLEPGHMLRIGADGSAGPPRCYWRFRIEPFCGRITERYLDDCGERIVELLDRSVEARLAADVPVGLFLSGGIDSSAILSAAAQHLPAGRVKAFSIGFNDRSFDESEHARAMAGRTGCDHRLKVLDLEQAKGALGGLIGRIGEPIGDPSILPTHLLCGFAREEVTVALSGDGGDELFAGYDPFKALAVAQAYRRLVPRRLHPAVRWLAGLLPASHRNMSLDFKLKRGLRGAGYAPCLWNPVWMGALEPDEIAELFDEPVDPEELYAEAIATWNDSESESLVDRSLEFFTRFYLEGAILTKTDRASMQVSLEVRAPFLDYDLVEFARRLPHQLKYRRGETKWILKRALRGRLPAEIVDRPKKGFGIPLSRWLADFDVPVESGPYLLRDDRLESMLQQHVSGARDNRLGLWCWLNLAKARNAAAAVAAPPAQ